MTMLPISLIGHLSLPIDTENVKNCGFYGFKSLQFAILVQALDRPASLEDTTCIQN